MAKVIARHKYWVSGCTITETIVDQDTRRFTATVLGWRNWKIYEGPLTETIVQEVCNAVCKIRESIKSGDENIFKQKGFFITSG